MARSITFNRYYDATLDEVWHALTDAEAMSEWLMSCDIVAEVGYEFQFRTKPYPGFDGITRCKVLEVREKELLSFSWSGGSLKNTTVTFKLSEENGQTRLDFEHTGFEGFVNSIIVRKILANGWKKKILAVQLPQFLAK